MKFIKHRAVLFVSLFIVSLLLSLPVTTEHRFLEYDDFYLVDPMMHVSSFAEYRKAVQEGIVADVNPVRDFSYWLEIQVASETGFINHQFVNIVFWFIAVYFFYLILLELSVASPLLEAATVFVALHPLQSSVYWIASRKHILSTMFILGSAYFLLKTVKTKSPGKQFMSVIFYTLSILSQPITLGFPAFAGLWVWRNQKENSKRYLGYIFAVSLIGIVVAVVNFKYYSSAAYQNMGGIFAPKFQSESLQRLMARFLIWGRDCYQILFPIKPAVTSYNVWAPEAYIGCVLLVMGAVAIFRWRKQVAFEWLALMWVPVFAVTASLTSQGGMDTYLLTPLFAFVILLVLLLQKFTVSIQKISAVAFVFLTGFFIFIDHNMAVVWSTPDKLWSYAYQKENSEPALLNYLQIKSNDLSADQNELWQLTENVYRTNSRAAQLGYILGRLISNKNISYEEREILFAKYDLKSPWYYYLWGLAEAQSGHYAEGTDKIASLWSVMPQNFIVLMRYDLDSFEAKWTKMCVLAGRTNCDQIHQQIEIQKQAATKR